MFDNFFNLLVLNLHNISVLDIELFENDATLHAKTISSQILKICTKI